jgi:predicted DNA-binding protein with PD1-like motif
MRFQRFGDRYQVRLEPRDELIASVTALAEREGIGYASLTGLGAVESISLAYLNRETRQYETHVLDEQLELLGVTGNITLRDGKPFPHVHASVSDRALHVYGGHVMAATAWPNVEIWLRREAEGVARVLDEESGAALMDLPERL